MIRRAVTLLPWIAAACGGGGDRHEGPPVGSGGSAAPRRVVDAAAPAVVASTYPDLAAAIAATVPADARVLGFGEIHVRTDRAQVRSALDHFTREALPALADRLSDLVIETWVQDAACGAVASEATARVAMTMRRPVETTSEIGRLAEAARAAKIQPRAMRITCADYARVAPPGQPVDAEAMLALTTRELGRVTTAALAEREGKPLQRPWIAVYGGALHNDRFPEPGTEEWSYAPAIEAARPGGFVEIDLIVPELAADDAAAQRQPWFPLVARAAASVQVWRRGERSFVIVLPRSG